LHYASPDVAKVSGEMADPSGKRMAACRNASSLDRFLEDMLEAADFAVDHRRPPPKPGLLNSSRWVSPMLDTGRLPK